MTRMRDSSDESSMADLKLTQHNFPRVRRKRQFKAEWASESHSLHLQYRPESLKSTTSLATFPLPGVEINLKRWLYRRRKVLCREGGVNRSYWEPPSLSDPSTVGVRTSLRIFSREDWRIDDYEGSSCEIRDIGNKIPPLLAQLQRE